MRDRERANRRNATRALVAVAILAAVCSCARVRAPDDLLANPEEMGVDTYGGWIDVRFHYDENLEASVDGELIAIDSDTVFVLERSLRAIPMRDVIRARMVAFNSGAGGTALLVTVGTISTLSHGVYLIFTAPAWILMGGGAASMQSFEPVYDYPKSTVEELSIFARFPAGIPDGVDRAALKPRAGYKDPTPDGKYPPPKGYPPRDD